MICFMVRPLGQAQHEIEYTQVREFYFDTLKRHGNTQTEDLPNIEFLHDF